MKKIYSLFLAGTINFAVSYQSGQKKASDKSATDSTSVVPELNILTPVEANAG